ncbi:MAG: RDD family protein [Longimicrobiales bacterium]
MTSPITAQIQGATHDLSRANGSYDAVELGSLTPDRLAEVLAAMTRLSPPEGDGDLCWPNLLVSGPTGDVAFTLADEHGRLVTEDGADVTDLGDAVALVTGVPFTGVVPAHRRGVAPNAAAKAHPHRKVPKPAQPGRATRPEQRSPQVRFDPRPREEGLGPKARELVGLVRQPVRLKEYQARFPYLMAGPGDPEFRRVTDELDASDLLREQKLMVQNLEPRAWAILHPGMGRRFLAFLLDLPIFVVFMFLGLAAIMAASEGISETAQGMAFLLWIVASYFLYFAASELVFGASPGGLVTGLRVVDERGRPPGLGLCLKRQLARIFRILGAVLTALMFSKARTTNARMAGGGMAARIATPGGSEVVLG